MPKTFFSTYECALETGAAKTVRSPVEADRSIASSCWSIACTRYERTSSKRAEPTAFVEAGSMSEARPPFPPFTHETAIQKIRGAEDAWNTRDPQRVALAYTEDSVWRNRAEFVTGRAEIVAFLQRKWSRELDYRLIKELWAVEGNRIAVRYAYESHDDSGNWFRSYGNENWEFAENGLMRRRFSSINDVPITQAERKFHWPLGPRPANHAGLSELGL